MVQIKLPDGSIKEYPEGVRPARGGRGDRQAAGRGGRRRGGRRHRSSTSTGRSRTATAAPIELRILTPRDREALDVLRHSTAHIMARAVMRLFPGVQLAFGPTTANGFYYDIDLPGRTSPRTTSRPSRPRWPRSSRTPSRSSGSACPSPRPASSSPTWARRYKVEHIDDELHKYGVLSFYRQGEFVDLCRGPHIPHAGKVGAFKLLSIAGAYWKGQTDRKMLQRLYGTAFFDKKDLDAYLAQVEEAKKRDHRLLGKQLKLFTISPAGRARA